MLIEKEVVRPGTYWYRDEKTGLPRKLVVTPELTKYWHDQGAAMLSAGLTIPVPCEHDFNSHPMTPADKLLNNSGWVKEYRLHDGHGKPGNRLFSVLDIQDEDIAKKLPGTIRWTSPWINSFTDGQGKEWKNVISHLALTTRPRIVDQAPFSSIAAALSLATEVKVAGTVLPDMRDGFCLTRAGRLAERKRDHRLAPRYPIAFSMFSGAALAGDDFPPPKAKKKKASSKPGMGDAPPPEDDDDDDGDMPDDDFEEPDGDDMPDDGNPANDNNIDLEPLGDPSGDVKMTELLCDLLGALGIQCEHSGDESTFKRALYNATMTKIHELTGKAQAGQQPPNRTNPPGQPPNNPKPGPGAQPNPLIQQEQQPMFMSIEDINKLPDPMRGVALAMYAENQKLRTEMEASKKITDSLRDAKIKEASTTRLQRVSLLGRLSPRVKADLDAMIALPAMALSMGDGGSVVDPMATTLTVLEKGLADLPRLLTTDASAMSVQPQPTDGDMLTEEQSDKIADDLARSMGCPPQQKKAG